MNETIMRAESIMLMLVIGGLALLLVLGVLVFMLNDRR